jgi:hypothetical protein
MTLLRRCALLLPLLGAGCGGAGGQQPPDTDRVPVPSQFPLPLDSGRVKVEDVVKWPHRRTVEHDLTGDGMPERVVLASDVSLGDDGSPLWEDGHRWAVFIDDGQMPTVIYSAFVPNGHVEAAVATGEGERRGVMVIERTPARLRTVVVSYDGPGRARTVSDETREVYAWAPDARS